MKRVLIYTCLIVYCFSFVSDAYAGILYGNRSIRRGSGFVRTRRSTAFVYNPLGRTRQISAVNQDLRIRRAYAKYNQSILKWKYQQAIREAKAERNKRREEEKQKLALIKQQDKMLKQMAQERKDMAERYERINSPSRFGFLTSGSKNPKSTSQIASKQLPAEAAKQTEVPKPKIGFWEKLSNALFGS